MNDSGEIRARRAPVAILLLFAWELGWALLAATPLHAWARATWGAHPDGDAVLFRAGGRELSIWLGAGDDATAVVVRTTMLLLILGAFIGQVPLAALVASLVRPVRATQALALGVRAWLPLSGILVIVGAVDIVLLMIGMFAGSSLDGALRGRLGDGAAFGVRIAAIAVFVVLAAIAGVVADLARVAIARHVAERDPDAEPESGLTVLRAGLGRALRTARRRLGPAIVGWGWRAALSAALLAAGWWAGSLVGGRGGAALVALFVAHQGVVLARTAVRASWLAHALRLGAHR